MVYLNNLVCENSDTDAGDFFDVIYQLIFFTVFLVYVYCIFIHIFLTFHKMLYLNTSLYLLYYPPRYSIMKVEFK